MPPPYLTHKKVCIRPNQLDVENNTHRYMYCSQPMGQTVDYIWNSGGGLTWFCPGSAGLMIIGAEKELIIMRRTWKWELNNNGLHCSSGAKMSLSYDLHPFWLSFGINFCRLFPLAWVSNWENTGPFVEISRAIGTDPNVLRGFCQSTFQGSALI